MTELTVDGNELSSVISADRKVFVMVMHCCVYVVGVDVKMAIVCNSRFNIILIALHCNIRV